MQNINLDYFQTYFRLKFRTFKKFKKIEIEF